ncbi:hypothetical protein GCM10010210_13640 [Pseudonocardia hydrocarbonoxydans]
MVEARQIGPYRLERLLGFGGMGEVHVAYDTRRDRQVALKLLPAAYSRDEEFQRRFRRESHVAARLREPHVIPIHDYGEIDGQLFIDMRLVDGRDVRAILDDRGALPPARTVHLLGQVADALEAAHADGLVHRDIKPSNVLVTDHDFVYVVDFGIARSVGTSRTSLTLTGVTIGTLDYMAPERFAGTAIDARADVYSLACLLYECLTGGPPFPGDDLPSLMYAHLFTEPPRPSTLVEGLPPEIDAVVARGMAKQVDDRFATPTALVGAAREALGTAPVAGAAPAAGADRPAAVPVAVPAAGTPADAPPTVPTPPPGPTPPAGPTPPTGPRAGPGAGAAGGTGDAATELSVATAEAPTVRVDLSAATRLVPAPRGPSGPPPPPQGAPHPAPARRGRGRVVAFVVAAAVVAAAVVTGIVLRPTGGAPAAPGPAPAATGHDHDAAPVAAASVAVPTVRGAVSVGPTPGYLEIAPNGRFAYIANRDARVITVLDTTINQVTATIPVEAGPPQFVTFSPDSSRAYVSIYNTERTVNLVGVLDTATNTVLTTIPVGRRPFASATTPDGTRLYVPSHDDGRIEVIDTATAAVVGRISVAPNPHWVAFSPDGSRLYAANHESNVVSVIDPATDTVLTTVPVGTSPHSTTLSPDGSRVAVVNFDSNEVSIIDTASDTVVATVPVGRNPQDVAYAADGRFLYTTDVDSDTLSVVDVGGERHHPDRRRPDERGRVGRRAHRLRHAAELGHGAHPRHRGGVTAGVSRAAARDPRSASGAPARRRPAAAAAPTPRCTPSAPRAAR